MRPFGPGKGSEEAKAIRLALGDITAIFKSFPRRSDPKNTDRVLRLDENYVESGAGNGALGNDETVRTDALASYIASTVNSGDKHPGVIAVYDHDGSILERLDFILGQADADNAGDTLRGRRLIVACRGKVKPDLIRTLASRVGCARATTVTVVTASWLRMNGANIDIVDAFLDAPQYEHGIRSMEAIVKMSRPVSGHFVWASLPAVALLEMHARKFVKDTEA